MNLRRIFLEAVDFLQQMYLQRHTIFELAKRDFTSQYIKNYFGLAWAILDPLLLITVLYLVFGVRFGDRESSGVPFVIYLLTGYITYHFFASVLQQVTSSVSSYSFLLKKVNFRSATLPIVKLLSNLAMHFIILCIAFILLMINSFYPNLYWLQLIYYIFAVYMLLLGIAWLTSSVSLFFPDIKFIVGIISRVLFFLTPIFWNIDRLPENYAFLLKFNPLFYIVNGYRESLVYGGWFWQHPRLTLYYWCLTAVIMMVGIVVFRKLRPHFADVV